MTKKRKKESEESELEHLVRERMLQVEGDAKLIEEGNFICPWCQKYVDPLKWWGFIEWNPYVEGRRYEPTLFHRGCAAPVPEAHKHWVKEVRDFFRDTPVKPGDYVQLYNTPPWRKYATRPRRVVDVNDEFVSDGFGLYYTLDISDVQPGEQRSWACGREAFDVVLRPYLKR